MARLMKTIRRRCYGSTEKTIDLFSYIRRLLTSFMLVFAATASIAAADTKGNPDGFETLMTNAMAFVVGKDDEILLVKAYGYRDTAKKPPITGKDSLSDRFDYKILHHDGARYARRPNRLEACP